MPMLVGGGALHAVRQTILAGHKLPRPARWRLRRHSSDGLTLVRDLRPCWADAKPALPANDSPPSLSNTRLFIWYGIFTPNIGG